jgi:hypothetical protein
MASNTKPGIPAPASGQYVQVGPRGGNASSSEITAVQGKPMPPTSRPGQQWQMVDPTKHKA